MTNLSIFAKDMIICDIPVKLKYKISPDENIFHISNKTYDYLVRHISSKFGVKMGSIKLNVSDSKHFMIDIQFDERNLNKIVLNKFISSVIIDDKKWYRNCQINKIFNNDCE